MKIAFCAALTALSVAATAEPPPRYRVTLINAMGVLYLCHRISESVEDGVWTSACARLSDHERCVETETTIECPQRGAPVTPPAPASAKKPMVGA